MDYLAIAETWFSESCPPRLDELVLSGYKLLSVDRPHTQGEVVTIIFRDHLSISATPNIKDKNSFEYITVKCSIGNQQTFSITIRYHSPTPSLKDFEEDFLVFLTSLFFISKKSIILGDFNFWANYKHNNAAQQFLKAYDDLGFRQRVDKPTHDACHTLDWVLHDHSWI